MTQSCDFRFSETAPHLAMDCVEDVVGQDGKPVHLRVLITPTGAYILPPPGTGKGAVPTPWMKINTASADPRVQQFAQILDQLQNSFDFKGFFPSSSLISNTTFDVLDGVPTTRYDITIKDALADSTDPAKQAAENDLRQHGLTTATSTIWFGANGNPVQLTSTLPTSKLNKPGIGDDTIVIKFTDWGKPVTVTDPPANQVTLFPAK